MFVWLVCALLVLAISSYVGWFSNEMRILSDALALLVGTASTFFLSVYVTNQIRRHDIEQSAFISTAFVVIALFLCLFTLLLFFRFYYSRSFLVMAFLGTLCVLYVSMFFAAQREKFIYGVIPPLKAGALPSTKAIEFVQLRSPHDSIETFDGLIAQHKSLTDEWQALAAAAAAGRLIVREDADFRESVTGRISTDTQSPIRAGDFRLNPLYSIVKQVLDVVVAVALLPAFFCARDPCRALNPVRVTWTCFL